MRFAIGVLGLFIALCLFFISSIKSVAASTYSLSGSVHDNVSNPITAATVDVFNPGTNTEVVTGVVSDTNGNYAVNAPEGTYDIQVTPPTGSTFSPAVALSQNISANKVLNFVLVPTRSVTLSGHIYDSVGTPVPNASFKVLTRIGTTPVTSATTDASGYYSVQVSPGTYVLELSGNYNTPNLPSWSLAVGAYTGHPAYSLTESKILDITIPAKKVDIHVQNPAGESVSGVALSANGFTMGGLSIGGDITDASGGSVYSDSNSPITDESGNAVLWLLPASYNITTTPPSGSGYQTFIFNKSITSDQTEIISLQLSNHAPDAVANSPYTVAEGSTVSLTGSGTDSDGDPLTYSWDLDNNGSFETLGQNVTFSAAGKSGPTSPTIQLKVCDDKNACDTAESTINVTDVKPDPGTITVSTNPVIINSSTAASSTFTDPAGSLDAPYTIEWNWGDGNVTTDSVDKPGAVSKDHTYTTAGVYEIKLTVTDADGGSDFETFQYLSVYSPTPQGLFSAGQKYTSPTGAYSQDPNITGNVMFGLSYKYQGYIPTGNRQFTMDFNSADFEFNATEISSLVISNEVATLRGTGTITDRAGTYNFLVVGKEGADTIRIQIKDQSA